MDLDSTPMFNSVEDECRYWKERAKLYHKEWTDVKQEFDEYVEQSRQMEAEMDATLDQKQIVIKDLRAKVTLLDKENESLKLKSESHSIEYANVEKQLENVKKERDSMKEYLRQLEQKNDDLERAHRILNESIVDFERMLDKAYEKNALLELEMDEKEVLQEKLQRLMDETRDLKQELNVKARYPANGSANNSINSTATTNTACIQNGLMMNNGDIITNDATSLTAATTGTNTITATTNNINGYNQQNSLKRKNYPDSDTLLNGNAMAASSRTNALNIVADMLRKLNLDKALLCPKCDKFRCICERTSNDYTSSSSSSSFVTQMQRHQEQKEQQKQCERQNATNNISSRISCNFINTFGSCNSISTNTSSASTKSLRDDDVYNATTTTTNTNTTTTNTTGVTPATNSTLCKSTSRSNTSLNFGTNIFKRFAERMSSGHTMFSTANATAPSTSSTAMPTTTISAAVLQKSDQC